MATLDELRRVEQAKREDLAAAHAFNLNQLAAAHHTEVERLRASHRGEVERINAQHQSELAARDERLQQRVEEMVAQRQANPRTRMVDLQSQLGDLQSQLALLMADKVQAAAQQARTAATLDESQRERTRLDGLLAELVNHQARITSALETQRARAQQAEQALGEATTGRDQLVKTIANLQLELQTVNARLRALEPLAASGRLARDLGSELSAMIAGIDGRTRHLLTHSNLTADYRREVETLRAEAFAALSLARQVSSRKLFEATEG